MSIDTPVGPRPPQLTRLPLSPQQRHWWSLCTTYPGTASPVALAALRLRGPLDVNAWARAVSAVIDRHEVLRTRFDATGPEPTQVVDPPHGLDVELIDLRDDPENEERARVLLDERWKISLDLERGPLVSASLLRLADDDHVWFFKVHHILIDGVSIGIIHREIAALYTEGALLPDVALHYGDFAVWYDAVRPEHDEELTYWLEQLDGVPSLELPTDMPRPETKAAPAGEVGTHLDAEALRGLDQLAADSGCTRFVVTLAALQVLLGRRSGQTDFCVGVPVAGFGRTRSELASVVGLFNNTLALRCDLAGDPTFRAVLAATADAVIDAIDFQAVPFSRVMAALKVPRRPGRAQVFQILFMYDEQGSSGGLRLPGVRIKEFPLTMPRIHSDLMVFAQPDDDGFAVQLFYDTALFVESTAVALADDYVTLLRTVAERPDLRLSELTVF